MAYIDKWSLAMNQDNIALVMMAMVDVALELMADPATEESLASYATNCLNSPKSYAERMVLGVVLTASSTSDAAIKAAVQEVFPAYAGVSQPPEAAASTPESTEQPTLAASVQEAAPGAELDLEPPALLVSVEELEPDAGRKSIWSRVGDWMT